MSPGRHIFSGGFSPLAFVGNPTKRGSVQYSRMNPRRWSVSFPFSAITSHDFRLTTASTTVGASVPWSGRSSHGNDASSHGALIEACRARLKTKTSVTVMESAEPDSGIRFHVKVNNAKSELTPQSFSSLSDRHSSFLSRSPRALSSGRSSLSRFSYPLVMIQ